MRRLELSDVKNLHEYELIRDDWRREVIETKSRRRVLLGPLMSILFENRLTVLHQVQEMCRVERIVRPELIQAELDVYNELLPDAGELGATLLVEITNEAAIQPELDRLIGLASGRCLSLSVGGRNVYARFLAGQGREDRISAVQYLRFPVGVSEETRAAMGLGPVFLAVEHRNYHARAELSETTRRELVEDLEPEG